MWCEVFKLEITALLGYETVEISFSFRVLLSQAEIHAVSKCSWSTGTLLRFAFPRLFNQCALLASASYASRRVRNVTARCATQSVRQGVENLRCVKPRVVEAAVLGY